MAFSVYALDWDCDHKRYMFAGLLRVVVDFLQIAVVALHCLHCPPIWPQLLLPTEPCMPRVGTDWPHHPLICALLCYPQEWLG